ncbi:MAG TPA: TonB family protein [Stellaceae bacterium]|nr:TonB family protein [Stellaceae bacterium]
MDRSAPITGPSARLAGFPDQMSLSLDTTSPDAPPPSEGHAPLSADATEGWSRRRLITVLGLAILIHALLIGGIVWYSAVPPPIVFRVIPVRIVPEVPPPPRKPPPKPRPVQKSAPKPAPKPQPKPQPKPSEQKPPPRGPLASEETGDVNAPPDSKKFVQTPPAGERKPVNGGEKPKPKGETALDAAPKLTPNPAALGKDQPPKLPDFPDLTAGGPTEPAPQEKPRPSGHRGKVPGPDATKNEYLAYLKQLITAHGDILFDQAAGRGGDIALSINILPSGHVVWVEVSKSSGYPDIDQAAVAMVNAVGDFPPLPKYFGHEGVTLTFTATLQNKR